MVLETIFRRTKGPGLCCTRGLGLGRAERLAKRLANRVADLERTAMTIPVGAVVAWEGETEYSSDEE